MFTCLRNLVTKKVKCTLVQALRLCTGRTAHRGSRGIALLFLYHGTRRGQGHAPAALYPQGKIRYPVYRRLGGPQGLSEGSASRPGRSLPPGKTRHPLYRRLCGSQGRSGQVRKISPPHRDLIPRTVQPVASRYTESATQLQRSECFLVKIALPNIGGKVGTPNMAKCYSGVFACNK